MRIVFKGCETCGRLKNYREGVESICCLAERRVKHQSNVRGGGLEEKWFSSVLHVGGLVRDVVSQVVGKKSGHSMSKNCLGVFPSQCQGRPTYGKGRPSFAKSSS